MTTKHGYPIIEFRRYSPLTSEAVIIAKRPQEHQPYVVWNYDMRTGNTFSGGYYDRIEQARSDFDNRQHGG